MKCFWKAYAAGLPTQILNKNSSNVQNHVIESIEIIFLKYNLRLSDFEVVAAVCYTSGLIPSSVLTSVAVNKRRHSWRSLPQKQDFKGKYTIADGFMKTRKKLTTNRQTSKTTKKP